MARRAAKSEKLTDYNLEKVIGLLEAEKPITKKAACEILGIAYNTPRLGALIEQYKKDKAYKTAKRRERAGKPATAGDRQFVVTSYLLDGMPISKIADSLYRTTLFVNNILERLAVPKRGLSVDYANPLMLPDASVAESFEPGEVVWSARYNTVAKVIRNCGEALESMKAQPGVYKILVKGEDHFYAYQPVEELGSLKHLKQYGI